MIRNDGSGEFAAVLEAAKRGDNEAVGSLYETYHPLLIRYLRWEQPDVAEDLEGDVWLAVAQSLKRFKGDERHFKAWLFTIARHRVVDHRRRMARSRIVFVEPEVLYGYAGGAGGAGTGDPADELVANMTAQEAVAQLTAGLAHDQAEVIVLRVLGGLSVSEVARIIGKRPGTVRVLTHRALERIARQSPERKGSR